MKDLVPLDQEPFAFSVDFHVPQSRLKLFSDHGFLQLYDNKYLDLIMR